MIGVACAATDLAIAREFFELFKTPWEVAVPGRHYGVLVSADEHIHAFDADLALVYGATELPMDREAQAIVTTIGGPAEIQCCDGHTLPLYGSVARFSV